MIRGLGRATRDFFLSEKSNRHRAEGRSSTDDASTEEPAARPTSSAAVDPQGASFRAPDVHVVDATESDRVATGAIPLAWMFPGGSSADLSTAEGSGLAEIDPDATVELRRDELNRLMAERGLLNDRVPVSIVPHPETGRSEESLAEPFETSTVDESIQGPQPEPEPGIPVDEAQPAIEEPPAPRADAPAEPEAEGERDVEAVSAAPQPEAEPLPSSQQDQAPNEHLPEQAVGPDAEAAELSGLQEMATREISDAAAAVDRAPDPSAGEAASPTADEDMTAPDVRVGESNIEGTDGLSGRSTTADGHKPEDAVTIDEPTDVTDAMPVSQPGRDDEPGQQAAADESGSDGDAATEEPEQWAPAGTTDDPNDSAFLEPVEIPEPLPPETLNEVAPQQEPEEEQRSSTEPFEVGEREPTSDEGATLAEAPGATRTEQPLPIVAEAIDAQAGPPEPELRAAGDDGDPPAEAEQESLSSLDLGGVEPERQPVMDGDDPPEATTSAEPEQRDDLKQPSADVPQPDEPQDDEGPLAERESGQGAEEATSDPGAGEVPADPFPDPPTVAPAEEDGAAGESPVSEPPPAGEDAVDRGAEPSAVAHPSDDRSGSVAASELPAHEPVMPLGAAVDGQDAPLSNASAVTGDERSGSTAGPETEDAPGAARGSHHDAGAVAEMVQPEPEPEPEPRPEAGSKAERPTKPAARPEGRPSAAVRTYAGGPRARPVDRPAGRPARSPQVPTAIEPPALAPSPSEALVDAASRVDDATTPAKPDPDDKTARPTKLTSVARPPGASRPSPPRRLRQPRFGGGGGAGPTAGYVVLAVLAVVCVALIVAVVLKTRADAAAAAREAANYTPPPLSVPTPSAAAGPLVAVVGDASTLTAGKSPSAADQWPALLGGAVKADVRPFVSASARYAGGSTSYLSEVQKVPSNTAVIVFVGGAGDQYDSMLTLASAATKAYGAAHAQAPKAKIVVVGPMSRASPVPSSLTQTRDTLESAARIAQAQWVDPIDDSWLGSGSGLVAPDGTPTAKGEQALESRMQSVVGPLVR